jgi:hypothetical protein
MSLVNRIKSALGFKPPLRNKVGGMSWIKGIAYSAGAEQMNNRAVKTVRMADNGLWEIKPQQRFVCTQDCRFGASQRFISRGQAVWVGYVADELLEPWKEDGVTDGEVREFYAPKLKESSHV